MRDVRHVRQEKDVRDVKEEETKRIPIVITAPVGSNTQLMLGAIHSSVRENSLYLKTAA